MVQNVPGCYQFSVVSCQFSVAIHPSSLQKLVNGLADFQFEVDHGLGGRGFSRVHRLEACVTRCATEQAGSLFYNCNKCNTVERCCR
jgi:hypothetical protein